MKAINKIILGFIVSISISVADAQVKKLMFVNAQPTRRIYNSNEMILPNYLQFEKTGSSGNVLKSIIGTNLVKICWQTKKEINTSHFELQRSIDGRNFEPVETITASGVSQKSCSFSAIDTPQNVNNDRIYYRVKTVFVNGKEAFTATLMVDMNFAAEISINNER